MNVTVGLGQLIIVLLGVALLIKLLRARPAALAALGGFLFLLMLTGLVAALLLTHRRERVFTTRHHEQAVVRLADLRQRQTEARRRAEARLQVGIERVHAAEQRTAHSRAVVIQMQQDQDHTEELQYHDPSIPIPLTAEAPTVPDAPVAPEEPLAVVAPNVTTASIETASIETASIETASIAAEIDSDEQLIYGPAALPIDAPSEAEPAEVGPDSSVAAEESVVAEEVADRIAEAPAHEEAAAESPDAVATGDAAPEWVDMIGYEWDSRVYRTAITVGPLENREAVAAKFQDELTQAMDQFVAWYRQQIGRSEDRWYDKFPFRYNARALERECVRAKYEAEAPNEILGENWPVTYALVEFDGKFQRQVDRHFEQVRSLARTGQAGVGAATLVGLLATLFGYLKFDRVTAHQCRGRLRLAALGTLGVLAGGIALLAGWLPWI